VNIEGVNPTRPETRLANITLEVRVVAGQKSKMLHLRFCANSFMLGGGGSKGIFVVGLGVAVWAEKVCHRRAGRARRGRIRARVSRRSSRRRRSCHFECMTRRATGGDRRCCRDVLADCGVPWSRPNQVGAWGCCPRVDLTRREETPSKGRGWQ
jgi:hypothetical protein